MAWIAVLLAAIVAMFAPAAHPVGWLEARSLTASSSSSAPAPAPTCSKAIDYARVGVCMNYGTYSDCSGKTAMALGVVAHDVCFDHLGTKFLLGHNTNPWGRIREGRTGDVVRIDGRRLRVTGHYYAEECTGGGEAYYPAAVHLGTSSAGTCSPMWTLQLNP